MSEEPVKLKNASLDSTELEKFINRRSRKNFEGTIAEPQEITGGSEAKCRELLGCSSWACLPKQYLEQDSHYECNLARPQTRSINRNHTDPRILYDGSDSVKFFHLIQGKVASRTFQACATAV